MAIRLRRGSSEDRTALLSVVEDPQVAFWLFAGPPPEAGSYLRPDEGSEAGPLYVAETAVERRLIGGGRIEREGFSYFVRPTEWGKGYGAQIARLMLAEFRRRSPSAPAVLTIRRENQASIRIVERLGFRFAGRVGVDPVMLRFVQRP